MTLPWTDKPLDALSPKDDEGAMAAPAAISPHPIKPDGWPRLDTTVAATRDAGMVVKGATILEKAGITLTSSLLRSIFLESMMVTRGMPNLATVARALTDGPVVFGLLLMALFFLLPSGMQLFNAVA